MKSLARNKKTPRPSPRRPFRSAVFSSVAVKAVVVTVLVAFAVVAPVQLLVAEARAVVLVGVPVGAVITEAGAPAPVAILAPFLNAFVVARVERGLAELEGAAVVAVAIPTATAAVPVVVVSVAVTIPVAVTGTGSV